MSVIVAIASGLLAVVMAVTGILKVVGHESMRDNAEHFGFSMQAFKLLGLAEIAGAIGLIAGNWWTALGVISALAILLLLVGAAILHLHVDKSVKPAAPAVLCGALAAFVAAGWIVG